MFLYLLLFAAFSHAKFEIPGFELVYTAPSETSLQTDDLRGPVEVWKEMIDGAKKKIDLEQMYASSKSGEALDEVISSLEAAGKRGVKIRFILEQKMLRASLPETIERLKKIENLELRVLEFGKISSDAIIHAKYMVVDNKIAYVGSQNFDWRSLKHIHETGLKITHAVITRNAQRIFDHDWHAWELLEKGKKVPVLNTKVIPVKAAERAYLVASPNAYNPKDVPDSELELVRLISNAKEEIRIQLLDYYPLNRDGSPYRVIDNALREAQARKVKIKLLVSHWNQEKPGIDHVKSLATLPGIEVRIITIPQSKEGVIPFARVAHSKTMTIDGKIAWIGTSNWSGGYLNRLRNLEVVIVDDKMAKRVADLQEQAWSSSYSEKIDLLKDYPKPKKGGE